MPFDLRPHLGADHAAHRDAELGAGRASDDAGVCRDPSLRLAERLAEIDRALDRAPGPIRYRPLRRAIWRVLLLPADFVLWTYRRQLDAAGSAGKPAEDPDALQAMAYALVARAILGDGRAAKLLFDLVDGRPGRRREVRTSSTDGIGPEAIEALVRFMNERPSADLGTGAPPPGEKTRPAPTARA